MPLPLASVVFLALPFLADLTLPWTFTVAGAHEALESSQVRVIWSFLPLTLPFLPTTFAFASAGLQSGGVVPAVPVGHGGSMRLA